MFSAFQTLNAEGQALWVLYCVPHSLDSILWQKAKLWAAVATLYPLAMFASEIVVGRHDLAAVRWSGRGGAAGRADIRHDRDRARRVRLRSAGGGRSAPCPPHLHVSLHDPRGALRHAIYAPNIWQRAALIVFTALVAIALWQRARDQFDYLLDPSASPPPRVSVSDGLIAALIFFVLQGDCRFGRGLHRQGKVSRPVASFGSRSASPALRLTRSCGCSIGGRARQTFPACWPPACRRHCSGGLVGGVAASLAGFGYIKLSLLLDSFPGSQPGSRAADAAIPLWLAALAIIAAPVFEEFIFRGLIFGGLRRSLGLTGATLASAAIFAIVHPPASVIPVFIMGACAALVYEHSKMLAAPMLLHELQCSRARLSMEPDAVRGVSRALRHAPSFTGQILQAACRKIDRHLRRGSPVPGPFSWGRAICAVRRPHSAAARRSLLCAATIMQSPGGRSRASQAAR